MKVTPEQWESLRILLGGRRDQIIAALALVLHISRDEVLARLGVRSVTDLKIAPYVPPPAPRRRGRPSRVIDPVAVLAALRANNGSIRRAAQQTGVPRATLGRYIAMHFDRSAWAYGIGVLPEHGQLLQASGISPEVARARGYRSVGPEDVPALRRGPQRYTPARAAAAVPGLFIPVDNTTKQRERLRILLDDCRDQIVAALALALDVSRGEVLARLGVRRVTTLKIAPYVPPPAPRRRGRPLRAIAPATVLAALRASDGSVRRAAQQTSIPRATLGRYIAMHFDRSAWAYGIGVLPEHGQLLQASGISPEVARARGYRSVGPEDVPALRRGPQRYTPARAAAAVPGLQIPVWDIEGVAWSQIRPDTPPRLWSRFRKRKQRYINCSCARPVVDVCPAARELVLDETRTLYITEGARHADAATSHGLACVATMGVRMIPHDEGAWSPFKLQGRKVVIVFDADVQSNQEVAAAEEALGHTLVSLGALVSVARLPAIAGRKTGLDDYLAAGHTEADLLATRKFPFRS